MENDGNEGSDAIFRFPNSQLRIELNRMETLLKHISTAPQNQELSAFRLSSEPFYLKFCPRIAFNPDETTLVKGIYIPISYWQLIEQSSNPNFQGARGGKRLTFENVGRYFTNTEFISLIHKSWIGTTPAQSGILKKLVREILETGKAVVLAIQTNKKPSAGTREVSLMESFDEEDLY